MGFHSLLPQPALCNGCCRDCKQAVSSGVLRTVPVMRLGHLHRQLNHCYFQLLIALLGGVVQASHGSQLHNGQLLDPLQWEPQIRLDLLTIVPLGVEANKQTDFSNIPNKSYLFVSRCTVCITTARSVAPSDHHLCLRTQR
jgi:hypothetical protein